MVAFVAHRPPTLLNTREPLSGCDLRDTAAHEADAYNTDFVLAPNYPKLRFKMEYSSPKAFTRLKRLRLLPTLPEKSWQKR